MTPLAVHDERTVFFYFIFIVGSVVVIFVVRLIHVFLGALGLEHVWLVALSGSNGNMAAQRTASIAPRFLRHEGQFKRSTGVGGWFYRPRRPQEAKG